MTIRRLTYLNVTMDLSISHLTGQAVGLCVTAISVYGLTRTCDKQFRRMGRWTALVDFLHWALLGAQTGALTALLITARVWAAERLQDRSAQAKGLALAGFSMLFTIAMMVTWSGPVSMLPWLAVLNASYAYFFTTGVRLRAHFVLTNACWIGYALSIGSIGGLATSMITTTVGIVTVWNAWRQRELAAVA